MSYMTKILVGAVLVGLGAFLLVWFLTSPSYSGNPPGIGTRIALGALCSGAGAVTGALCGAVFCEKDDHPSSA